MLIMNVTINMSLKLTGNLAERNLAAVGLGMVLGIQTPETGVLGGIIVGVVAYHLHENFFLGRKVRDFFCKFFVI